LRLTLRHDATSQILPFPERARKGFSTIAVLSTALLP
jgi:hypothetical protein